MSFITKAKRPHLFSMYQVQMRTPGADEREAEPAEDFIVAVDTLQQAINFANTKFPGMDITLIRQTHEQIYYGIE